MSNNRLSFIKIFVAIAVFILPLSNLSVEVMAADHSVTATYSEILTSAQYTLTVNIVGSGTVSLNPPGGTYDEGTTVTLTAKSSPYWGFDGWSGDLSGIVNPETITMDTDKTVTVTFTEESGSPIILPVFSVTASTDDGNVPSNTLDDDLGTRWSASGDPQWIEFDLGSIRAVTSISIAWFEGDERVYNFDIQIFYCGDYVTMLSGGKSSGTTLNQENFDFIDLPTRYVRYVGHGNSLNPLNSITEVDIYGFHSGTTTTTSTTTTTTTMLRGVPVFEESVTGMSASSAIVASDSITGVNDNLYLAAISTKPHTSVFSVSGLGLTWTLVDEQCSGRSQTGISLFQAKGTVSGIEEVTANLSSAPSTAVIAVARYSKADAIGNVESANTLGLDGACSGGIDSDSYSVNLTTTVDSAVAFGAIAPCNETHTPGPDYTERAFIQSGTGGFDCGVALEDNLVASSSTVAVDGSISGFVDWAVIAAEIKGGPSGPPPAQYTLTVSTVGNGSVGLNPSGGTYDQGTVVILTANPDAGNQFDNWSGDLSGTFNPATITMNADKNVTANFSVIPTPQYTLTVNIVGSGSVDLNPPGSTYDEGTTVTMTANPSSSWRFDGWIGDLAGTVNPATITMGADYSVTATFTKIPPLPQYTLTVNIVGSGSVDLNPPGGTYYKGTTVTMTAYPSPYWGFDGWSGDLSGIVNPETITMDADKTVTVTYIEESGSPVILPVYSVTASKDNGRHVSSNTLDDDPGTRWSASGDPQWIEFDLGSIRAVTSISIAWFNGDERVYNFDIKIFYSGDYITMLSGGKSSGTTLDQEDFNLTPLPTRYVRYVGHGNSLNPLNSITEVDIYGFHSGTTTTTSTTTTSTTTTSTTTTSTTNGITTTTSGSTTTTISTSTTTTGGGTTTTISTSTTTTSVTKSSEPEEAVEAVEVVIPDEYALLNNYPNPFNPSTKITYSLPTNGHVNLTVYDMKGRLVSTLMNGVQNAGEYAYVWEAIDSNGNQLPSGMYVCRFQAGSHVETIKMTFMR